MFIVKPSILAFVKKTRDQQIEYYSDTLYTLKKIGIRFESSKD